MSERYSKEWFTSAGETLAIASFSDGIGLPQKLSVSEWADKNRMLSPESSAEVGRWNTARAEYQRGMMDAISDPSITEVTLMTSSQIGKTEIFNNALGYFIDQDPCPIMFLQPTLDMADAWSEDRLKPMMRDTLALRGRVSDSTRSNENRKRHKVFTGGHISVAGANSAASLASRPIRILFADEVDRYPYSAGVEGDPIKLAEKRTTTFWNKKCIRASTPTLKEYSRIAKSYEESDQRRYYVPCPHCDEYQELFWCNVKWDEGLPDTAYYLCEKCGTRWNDVERWRAVSKGEWRATKPFNGHAGFFLWEGYSPWVKLSATVTNFLRANREGQEALKVFVNTSLAELWEDKGERIDDTTLLARREDYGDVAPADVVVITAGVDVQGDRIEIDRFGWGADEQCWGLGKFILHGDPTGTDIWTQLDDILRMPIPHALAGEMFIMAAGVDSGFLTQQVGVFCQPRWGRRIWALKGIGGAGRPIWQQSPSKLKKLNLKFFQVGADQAKETIYSRLRLEDPTLPGYCHFNKSYDSNHFEQLTSEEVATTYKRGRPVRIWRLKEGRKRNEALDMMVYAMAALEGLRLMGLSLHRRKRDILKNAPITVSNPASAEEPKKADMVKSKIVMTQKKKRRVMRII